MLQRTIIFLLALSLLAASITPAMADYGNTGPEQVSSAQQTSPARNTFAVAESLKAAGLFSEAIEAYNAIPQRNTNSFKSRLWPALAQCYRNVGNYQKAVEYYEKQRALTAELNERYGSEATQRNHDNVLLNLSSLWIVTGQFDQVIDALEDMETYEGEEVRLINLSSAYLRTGRTDKALQLLDTAIQRHGAGAQKDNSQTEGGKKETDGESLADTGPDEAVIYRIALQNKGYILWAAGLYEEACRALSEAMPAYPETAIERYICEGNLAVVEAELGRFDQALRHIDQAIAWVGEHRSTTDMDYIILVRKKAEILLKQGSRAEAADTFKEYFASERDYILDNFLCMTEDERLNFWYTHSDLLAECYGTEDEDPDFLFDVALFSKSVLMQTNLKLDRLFAADTSLSRDYEALKALRFKIKNINTEYDNPTGNTDSGNNNPTADGESVKETREILSAEAARIERSLMERAAEIGSFRSGLTVTLNDVRKKLTDKDLAVEFIQYEKPAGTNNDADNTVNGNVGNGGRTCYAALVTGRKGPAKFIPLFTADEFNACLEAGGNDPDNLFSVSGSRKGPIQADTLLGRRIWAEILSDAPKDGKVYFSPDGIFHLLGIEYMNFDRPDLSLYRLSSTGKLCEEPTTRDYSSILLVGGLDYNDSSGVRKHPDRSPERGDFTMATASGKKATPTFKNLSGSSTEIDSIAPIWEARSPRILRKSAGTEDSVKVEMPGRNLMLLSTHGFTMDYELPERVTFAKDSVSEDFSMSRSGLAMAGVNICVKPAAANDAVEDGILTAREVSDLDLGDAALVVLSACETGLGRVSADGVIGLPRGFKKAGAGALLISLWDVNDKATQLLMSEFMRSLAAGDSKREALRKAQERVRTYEEPVATGAGLTPSQQRRLSSQGIDSAGQTVAKTVRPYSAPQYWAAFILLDGLD